MSSQDVELWDTLLSYILESAGIQDVPRLEVIKRVANEMTNDPCVLKTTIELCRT